MRFSGALQRVAGNPLTSYVIGGELLNNGISMVVILTILMILFSILNGLLVELLISANGGGKQLS